MEKKNEWIYYLMLFFTFSFIGWIWEILWEFLKNGFIINSGVLYGPWLPIYGSGGMFIYMILKKFNNNKLVVFLGSLVICSIIEYFTSLYLEVVYGLKWWNYSKRPFNLNGRICLLYSIAFGIGGYFCVHNVAPVVKKIFNKVSKKVLKIAVIILIVFFSVDFVYATYKPHRVKRYKINEILKANH